jgi:hypothetical protein
MRNASRSLSTGIVLTCLLSCDTSFNPSAPFQPRMVVYSIFTTESDTQYVRIYTTYSAPNNDSSQGQNGSLVTDAQVKVTQQDSTMFSFQLTRIEGADTVNFPSSTSVYRAYPFRPEKGKKYSLMVSSPAYGIVTGSTIIPGNGLVSVINSAVLQDPFNTTIESYGAGATLAPEARGFLVRLYLDYLSPLSAGGYQPKRIEVPTAMRVTSYFWQTYEEFYPHPVRRTTAPNAPLYSPYHQIKSEEHATYTTEGFVTKIRSLYDKEGDGIRFSKVVFYLVQFNSPLWDYWNVSNGFHDMYSIRIDEADYTNLAGGAGVLGGVAVDSTAFQLPQKFPLPRPK